MKQMTPEEIETAKFRAAVAAASLQGDPDRAEEFQDMSIEEYAELRGIEIVNKNPAPAILALVNPNPKTKKGKKHMSRETNAEKIARLEARVQELEDEKLDALEALGVEIIDGDEEGDDFEDEESDEGNGRD